MPYIDCKESFIPNTTMKTFENTLGDKTAYVFTPNDGYVLHLKRDEVEDTNIETGDTFTVIKYAKGTKSVSIDYDFSVVIDDIYTYNDESGTPISIPIQKVGAEELYTLPANMVPTDDIY